jgi:glycosyltransferase involved in cell wall biosynthesis
MKSRPLKLALVTRRYPPLIGGAEKVFSYLAAALSAEGAKVTVLTARPLDISSGLAEAGPGETAQNVDCGNPVPSAVKVERLATSSLRMWGTLLYMRNLAQWFCKNPVDLAYVSMLKHDAYSVLGVARRLGFPVVLRPEGAGATGDVAWQLWGNFGRTIGRRCRDANAFVAISPAIEAELRDAWERGTMRSSALDQWTGHPSPSLKIMMIPNGVPLPEVPWHCRANWSRAPRAVFVGRLSAEKGLETLVDTWPLVRTRHPNASLVLVGEGPERPALEARVQARGLTLGTGQAIDLPGALPDVTQVLREADLFVLPSREEGMSIALLEAMALGIPVVASAISGNSRVLVDFEHGRLVPPGNADRLAGVIIEQWSDFDSACRMSSAARRRVKQEFSIQIVARRHLDLFKELLGHRPDMKE